MGIIQKVSLLSCLNHPNKKKKYSIDISNGSESDSWVPPEESVYSFWIYDIILEGIKFLWEFRGVTWTYSYFMLSFFGWNYCFLLAFHVSIWISLSHLLLTGIYCKWGQRWATSWGDDTWYDFTYWVSALQSSSFAMISDSVNFCRTIFFYHMNAAVSLL